LITFNFIQFYVCFNLTIFKWFYAAFFLNRLFYVFLILLLLKTMMMTSLQTLHDCFSAVLCHFTLQTCVSHCSKYLVSIPTVIHTRWSACPSNRARTIVTA